MEADFRRFGRMHSWYKHIPLEGADYYAYQDMGEQPRLCVDEVNDIESVHWHFDCFPPKDKPYYTPRKISNADLTAMKHSSAYSV